MARGRIALAVGLVVASLAVSGCGGDDEEAAGTDTTTETTTEETNGATEPGSTLLGSVGPGFDISLTTATRQAPGTLSPGSYDLQVEDQSSAHNFHLTGPGDVDVATSVADEGTEHFQVELEPGTYTFVCDPHASQMNGSFEVGS
jgi:hypothetical protein